MSLVPESMLREFPDAYPFRQFLIWDGARKEGAEQVDPENYRRAIENTVAWIRAVVREEHIPEEPEEHIVGVVDSIDGYDVTRATFASDQFQFLVTQDSARIVVVASPLNEGREAARSSQQQVESYLRETLELLFKHAKAIQFLSQFEETPFGVKMTRDENLYDEHGRPLSREERDGISRLPQAQASEEYHRLTRLHEAKLLGIDPTIPRQPYVPPESTGGSINYWWGQVYAASDGHVVIFSAAKSNGGPLVVANCKNWFRKDGEPRRLPGNPRKWSSPGSLWPPKEDYSPKEENLPGTAP